MVFKPSEDKKIMPKLNSLRKEDPKGQGSWKENGRLREILP